VSALERKFLKKIGDEYKKAAPGLKVQAYHKGKKILDVALGKTHEIYDWASLTKIVFTTSALMVCFDEGKWLLNDRIHRWVHWFPAESTWQMRDLLTHSAGLTWWYPFYKQLAKKTNSRTSPEDAWEMFEGILKRRIRADFKKKGAQSLKRQALQSVYSDLDFFVLGFALEAMAETNLYSVWTNLRERLNLHATDFHRNNRVPRGHRDVAPTEKCAWRGKVLKGEVHDQNTWALRGVAPHAGLFGPIEDLSRWGLLLRASLLGGKKGFVSQKTARLFTKRAIPRFRGDWALGFMMPSKGTSSCGSLFSADSVGHTGFTGTSLWYDPKKDLLVTILSNRVHPTVANTEIRNLRPLIHTWIVEEI